jgi:chorismate mutase
MEKVIIDLQKELRPFILRAGVWKPRTSPKSFEGHGQMALTWLKELKHKYQQEFALEVANEKHVQLAIKAGARLVWIGARTVMNPFSVQEIVDAVKESDLILGIKNPLICDFNLWQGAYDRALMGLKDPARIILIHRGFQYYPKQNWRNRPFWKLVTDFRCQVSSPFFCDPSHMAGSRDYLTSICHKAMDLAYDGFMIEVHPSPDDALSDADQQLTPADCLYLLNELAGVKGSNQYPADQLSYYREKIDELDRELMTLFADRRSLIKNIAQLKKEHSISALQIDRFKEMMEMRVEWAKSLGIDDQYTKEWFQLIHHDSLGIQENFH